MKSNPFCSRFIRPGAIPFMACTSGDVEQACLNLLRNNLRGQIVGPHGSGKSTLLAAMIERLSESGMNTQRVDVGDAQERVGLPRHHDVDLVVIDGFEQLGWLQRQRLRFSRRWRRGGYLVSVHTGVGLPSICELVPDLRQLRMVVNYLLRDHEFEVSSEVLEQLFHQQGGNVREALFQLYDLYELSQVAPHST